MIEQLHIEKGIPIPPPRPSLPRPEGACQCGRMPRSGYKTCDRCLANAAKERVDRLAKGLCSYGGCPIDPEEGHTLCETHLKALRANAKARREKRTREKVCVDCGERPGWWGVRCVLCRTDYVKGPLPNGARVALKQYRRLEAIEARRMQAEAVIALTEKKQVREILAMRHGLVDGVDRTLEEIGKHFGLTRERIRQIEDRFLKEMAFVGIDVSHMRQPFRAVQRKPPKARRHLTSNEHRKKIRCHSAVALALASGQLTRQPCHCGNTKTVAHHADYDKPLEVEWLCRPHHLQAHGRGDGKPKPKGINWLDKISPSQEHYDARAIVSTIKARFYIPKIKTIRAATGLSYQSVRDVMAGKPVKNSVLLAMLRYVESLKTEKAAC